MMACGVTSWRNSTQKAIYQRIMFLFVLFISAILCLYNLGSLPLFDQDEPRYASAARTMIETGDYIVPYFNGQPRYQKPVFIYWLMCISFKLFGVNEFAARLPSAIAVIILVAVTLSFARVYLSSFGALVAALSLATSFGVVASGHVATTDAVLHLLIAGSFMSFFHAEQLRLKRESFTSLFWYLLAYALSGLAMLTKGPIGILLPIIGIGLYWILSGQVVDGLKRSHVLVGLMLILLINLPWWTFAAVRTSGEFLSVFLLRENLHRFATKGHAEPFWYFIPVLFVFFFPWSTFIPQAWLHGIRVAIGSFTSLVRRFKDVSSCDRLIAYCTFWSLGIIIFFSLSRGKNPQYILPSFAALALLCGWWFEQLIFGAFDRTQLRRACFGLILLSTMLCLSLLATPCLINTFFKDRFTYGDEAVEFGWGVYAAALFIAVCGVAGIIALRGKAAANTRVAFPYVLVCSMVAVNLSLASTVAPAIAHYRQEPLRDFAIAIGAIAHPDDAIVTFKRDQSSIVHYSRRVVMRMDSVEQLKEVIWSHKRTFIIAKRKDLKELLSLEDVESGAPQVKMHLIQERLAYALVIAKSQMMASPQPIRR